MYKHEALKLKRGVKHITKQMFEDVLNSRSKTRQSWPDNRRDVWRTNITKINTIRHLRKRLTAQTVDQLIIAKGTRFTRLNTFKAAKPFVALGGGLWSKTMTRRVTEAVDIDYDVSGAVNRANMEAVVRVLKKQGWMTRHNSKDYNGLICSRYISSPNCDFEVRLSNHDLPETNDRIYNHATFGTSWDYEITLNGDETPMTIIAEILEETPTS